MNTLTTEQEYLVGVLYVARNGPLLLILCLMGTDVQIVPIEKGQYIKQNITVEKENYRRSNTCINGRGSASPVYQFTTHIHQELFHGFGLAMCIHVMLSFGCHLFLVQCHRIHQVHIVT